jgi:cytochrome c553
MRRLTLVIVVAATFAAPGAAEEPDAGTAFFEAKIRPVLAERCYSCHGEQKQRGGLRLDSKEGVLKGGDTGPAIVPGKAADSLLIRALRHQGEPKMPPDGALPADVVADFAKWVAMGAPDPRGVAAAPVAKGIDWTAARQFWAFRPPQKPVPPAVTDPAWARTPIDLFILARLEAAGLRPVGLADRRALIRRATFDLTGLPPTPAEVSAFLADESPDAFATVIDRLLSSPHYGERWGRYWLDVARYAEDQAHTFGVKPNTSAYRYRDWVIAALNDDMPYDRFVKLQIAADLIVKDDPGRMKHLPALGFFGLGAQYYKNSDAAKAAADELDDRVDTLTRGFLALTVSCARCHDHKFDPIPQQDYYSLAGVFHSSRLANLPLAPKDQVDRFQAHQEKINKADSDMKAFVRAEKVALAEQHAGEVARYAVAAWKVQAQKIAVADEAKKDSLRADVLTRWVKYMEKPPKSAALEGWQKLSTADEAQAVQLAEALERTVRQALADRGKQPPDKVKADLLQGLFGENGVFAPTDAELNAKLPAEKQQRLALWKTDLARLQKDEAARPLPVAHGLAEGTATDLKVYVRGNPAKLGALAPRRFLRVLASGDPAPFTVGSGRLELAEAIASPDNPLTARVIVNRVWQYHFGRGLVGTPSNFGQLGDRPTHPELLDYLACRLVESGWSLKALHREIMLSSVYRLASASDDRNLAADAENRLLWRMNRRRLDVEAWRDAMLAVSGKLDPAMGGPTLELSAPANFRRTVYAKVSRHDLNELLRLFDFPDANITSERRTETTVPQQQLFVMNSPFVVELANALAARVQAESAADPARVDRAFQLAYGRPAADEELHAAMAFLAGQDSPAEQSANRLTRWERLAQVLLAGNEFLYVD